MHFREMLALSIVALAGFACGPAQDREGTLQEDRQAIERLHERHVQAALDEDVEAFLATVTDDFGLMPPNDPGARGKPAVRSWFETTFDAFSIERLEFPTTELHIDRDWAFRHYTYDWAPVPDAGGDPIEDRGDGMYVYPRQADGS